VLEELGWTFLSELAPIPHPDRRVGGVIVYDPLDEQAIPDGAVVLAVGVTAGPALRDVVAAIGEHGASALVLREPILIDDATAMLAQEQGVAMLGLTRGASWTQLSAMVSSLVAEQDPGQAGDEIGGLPTGDLFSLANAIAALLDAPVTIEDRNSRVLAFSARQDRADRPRIETILERQVPERYARRLTDGGFFKRLYASEEPVYIELDPGGQEIKMRCAIAVRAGGEILGSIWAVVPAELNAERTNAMKDAAKVVALELLRVRAGADVERRLRADLLSTALEGADGAPHALERLGLLDEPVVVLAAAVADPDEGPDHAGDRKARRQRIADAIAMHLAAVHPNASSTLLGGRIFGLLPVRSEELGELQAVRLANGFLARIGRETTVHIGVGRVARGPRGVVESREGAERALRVRTEQGGAGPRVARFSDVHIEAMLLELRDRMRAAGEQPTGPIARLLEHDKQHDSQLLETLSVWLDALGDVGSAANTLHVHPNTLRYRLRRISEVGGLDLGDPEVRFAAQLQLRIIPGLLPLRR
jgi:PucR C-terminal helix-turn-helix domain/GGDEF-like domain